MSTIPVNTFYPPNKTSNAVSSLEKRYRDDFYQKFRAQSTSTPYHGSLHFGHYDLTFKSSSIEDDSGYRSISSSAANDDSSVQYFETPSTNTFRSRGRHLAFAPLSPVLFERTIEYQPSFSEISTHLQNGRDCDWEIPEKDVEADKFNSYRQALPQHRLNFDDDDSDLDSSVLDSSSIEDCTYSVHKDASIASRESLDSSLSSHYRLNTTCDVKNFEKEHDCDCSVNEPEAGELNSSLINTSNLADRFDEVLKKFSPKEPDRLIGRKMGLLCVDIMGELAMRNISCISVILDYLEPKDLCRCCQVSREWKSICENDSNTRKRRLQFLSNQDKENLGKRHESRHDRGLTVASHTFGTLQQTGGWVTNSAPQENVQQNRFRTVASTLKNYESLRKCPKCQGPSKVLEVQERALCAQSNCGFDFCVKCLSNFHFEQACTPSIAKRPKTSSIGGKKSKKNLRRL